MMDWLIYVLHRCLQVTFAGLLDEFSYCLDEITDECMDGMGCVCMGLVLDGFWISFGIIGMMLAGDE